MKFSTLISVDGLAKFLGDPDFVIFDCRFQLADAQKGWLDYQTAHIPGAIYINLDDDLSAPVLDGQTGRHPLPDIGSISQKLGTWGVGTETQVVVYDDNGGMIAARLWWTLQWLGHENVALLDGGYPAWLAEGHPVTNVLPTPESRNFRPNIQSDMVFSADDVLLNFGDPSSLLIDSRSPERFRGEEEPIDPVAGRIPGAINYFWGKNINSQGHMQLKQVLKGRFESLFGEIPAARVTFYCGSGVTAAHNILAVAHAELGMPRMYAGSWSEWITDPERPITTGE